MVEDHISRRTIGRIKKEGGIAAKLQFVEAVHQQGASVYLHIHFMTMIECECQV